MRNDRVRAVRIAVVAGLVLALLGIASAPPAAAACDGPFPSFREAARTATRIVVGDVVAAEPDATGYATRFTLRVTDVLRGSASATLTIRDLPATPCTPPISARLGDRIAIALGDLAFEPPMRVNAVAFVRGTPPDYPGIERITMAELLALVGPPPPATSTDAEDLRAGNPGSGRLPAGPIAALIAVLASLAIWVQRLRRHEAG